MAEQPGLLIVDDEEDILKVVNELLKRRFPSHTIYKAKDGEEALEVLSEHSISLVITDFSMPGMSGLELIKRVRKEYPEISLILMTGQADLDVALKSVESGACQYIQKPFESLKKVASVVEGALQRGSMLHQLNEDLMRLVIESIPEALILIDKDRQIKFVNPRAKWLLKAAGVEENAINFENIVSVLQVDPWEVAKDHPPVRECSIATSAYELFVAPLKEDGTDELGYLLILHDLTAQKESERLQTEFVSLVSHEFRTPLSVIKSGIDLILNKKIPQEHTEPLLLRSKEQIKRLTELINNILDLSKLESGMLELAYKDTEIQPLFKEVIEFLRQGGEEQAEIKLEFVKGTPETIEADPNRLQQIIINIVGNALKFTPADRDILVRVDGNNEELQVEVSDHGPGIPKDRLGDIFKKFKQADPYLTRTKEGTGLGLPLAKSLVEAHGGTIEVESEEGNGATFRFKIPVKRAELPKAA
ncbi:ATP-binding protein [Bdellovibrionota bacterium]